MDSVVHFEIPADDLKRAEEFSIEAKIAGRITKNPKPEVTITSQLTKGKQIIYQ